MPFQIGKTFTFAASHQLDHLPENHKCHRLHGHNYTVTVTLEAQVVDTRGFVVDYADLGELKEYIDTRLDHRHLNDQLGSGESTTAEALAWTLFHVCADMSFGDMVAAVTVKETEATWATYSE